LCCAANGVRFDGVVNAEVGVELSTDLTLRLELSKLFCHRGLQPAQLSHGQCPRQDDGSKKLSGTHP
jgi:hypothetical protein